LGYLERSLSGMAISAKLGARATSYPAVRRIYLAQNRLNFDAACNQ
jgi:hypothetical protein